MSRDTTEQLAQELAHRLEPVERLPTLRRATLRVLAAGCVGVVLALLWVGINPGLLRADAGMWVFVALVGGLTLMGSGATVAALALGIPGCTAAARVGLAGAGLGLTLSLAWVPFGLAQVPPSVPAPWPSDLGCLLQACVVGVLPAAAALWFLAQAVPHRPGLAVLAAATGAVGLGALAVEMSCPVDGLRHLLFGHALAPLGGGALLALPLLGLRRLLRRRA